MKTIYPDSTEKFIQMIRAEFRRRYKTEPQTPPPEIAGELLLMIKNGLSGDNNAK